MNRRVFAPLLTLFLSWLLAQGISTAAFLLLRPASDWTLPSALGEVALLPPFFLFWRRRVPPRALGIWPPRWRRGDAAALFGILFVFALSHFLPVSSRADLRFAAHLSAPLWEGAVLALLAASVEEIVFRGYLLRLLLSAWPAAPWVAILGSSLSWTLFHVPALNPLALLFVFFVGCLMATYAWSRGNLYPLMAAHFLWDWYGFVALATLAGH